MAEAVAIIGLITSIASLIDLSAKVVSRLHEFTSKTSDVPESFRSLSIQLPLLTLTIQRIHTQAQAGTIPDDVTSALTAVIDGTSTQVSVLQRRLSDILPPDGATKLDRALKALKSLTKEDKVRQAVKMIHRNIDVLTLHLTTRHVHTGDRILEELTKLRIESVASAKALGVCLGQAPRIEPDAFIGRANELQKLQGWLSPTHQAYRQCVVSIVGMGGMGKTQLSLAHVQDCGDDYSSVFWVNAKDETNLRQSMADLCAVIFHDSSALVAQGANDERLKIDQIRRWLSEAGNDRWLLIFDNYDDPYLPGTRSPTGYDIRSFFPTRSQGSILITSRSTKLTFSKQLRLQKLEDVEMSVDILSQRSGRDLSRDCDAFNLARRLDGLPLALATAGTYLGRANISCDEYLKLYNSTWMDLVGPDTEELLEYEARTMSSTWIISLDQVRRQDADAAELLVFVAYLSNRDIWYNLIRAGAHIQVPWMRRVTESKTQFQRAMSKLHNYNLVDVVAGSYQVHPCLHDWLAAGFSTPPQPVLFSTALACIAENVEDKSQSGFWINNRRLLEHIEQLESPRFQDLWQLLSAEEKVLNAAHTIAGLQQNWNRLENAERMYRRAVAGKERVLGSVHTSTLATVNNLGNLYRAQDKLDKAEEMYFRALAGYEKALGPDHPSTLNTVNDLGSLHRVQGKLDESEKMYFRALAGYEKALGPDHPSTLNTVNDLGSLHRVQGRLDESEKLYSRTLAGCEKALGPDHPSTLNTVNDLGSLHRVQGRLDESEKMYFRALAGYEKALGPDHPSTLNTVNDLGSLHRVQGKLDEAEKMYFRALAGYEKALGPDHPSTLNTVNDLGSLHRVQGKLDESEKMYFRALAGYKKALGPDHPSTLDTAHNLSVLYSDQGNLDKMDQIYRHTMF